VDASGYKFPEKDLKLGNQVETPSSKSAKAGRSWKLHGKIEGEEDSTVPSEGAGTDVNPLSYGCE